MKKLLLLTMAIGALGTISFAQKTDKVRGYEKKDGTRVEPYDRTAPDKTKDNNWSTKGNENPENGKKGTKKRDGE